MFIDSHCHIDGQEYDADREEVIARARDAGVTTMLNVGTGDPHSGAFERAVELAETHEGIYAAIGVHPHDAKLFDNAAEQRLLDLARRTEKVIAWGEIGLDYHYDHSPRHIQKEVFIRQMELARLARLPIIIHCRPSENSENAWHDCMRLLNEHWMPSGLGGVLHCFTGSLADMQAALDLGFMISFAGN